MRLLTRFTAEAITVTVFVALAIATVLGAPAPSAARAVGYFRISPNPSGISIYQPGNHRYTLFSPYNDYSINDKGQQMPLVQVEELTRTPANPIIANLTQKMNLIASLTGTEDLSQTFRNNYIVRYNPKIVNNTVTVTRTVSSYPQVSHAQILAMTMTYERDDIVLDGDRMVYTENTDDELTTLAGLIGKPLERNDTQERRPEVASTTVVIMNPGVAGILIVYKKPGQRMFINKDAKRLEIEEENTQQNQEVITTTMRVVSGNTIAEANL